MAFQYGSIVFFNFGDDEEVETLTAVRKFCTDEFRETRKDGISFTCHSLYSAHSSYVPVGYQVVNVCRE